MYNERDTVWARARVDDRVAPGVVALQSGWWASLVEGGAAVNALTAARLTGLVVGAAFHDALVEVERVVDRPPGR